jgi:hypothetical protein
VLAVPRCSRLVGEKGGRWDEKHHERVFVVRHVVKALRCWWIRIYPFIRSPKLQFLLPPNSNRRSIIECQAQRKSFSSNTFALTL